MAIPGTTRIGTGNITPEVRAFGEKVVLCDDWKPEESRIAKLPKSARHAIMVSEGRNAKGVQLTLCSWPRIQRDDYNRYYLFQAQKVYMNVAHELLEITHPDLANLTPYVDGTMHSRTYLMSSTMVAMLWQKAVDTPEGWQQYVGPIDGIAPLVEDGTEWWLRDTIMLDQWSNGSMNSTKAMEWEPTLETLRSGNKPQKKKARVSPEVEAKAVFKKLVAMDAFDKYYLPEEDDFHYEPYE